MSTPQDSPRRRKQKARRTKQLAEWREKQIISGEKKVASPVKTAAAATVPEKPKKKTAAAK